jgi:hypothetical protein
MNTILNVKPILPCRPLHTVRSLPARVFRGHSYFPALLVAGLLSCITAVGAPAEKKVAAPVKSDLRLLQCGNLIYAGNKSSVCFADSFLKMVSQKTSLRVNQKFCPVRLESDALFDFPFCVMSGNDNFSLNEKERAQLRKYLAHGGFLLVSPGCSDEKWDKAFRRELQICFPDNPLTNIPMSHPIFSIVSPVAKLTDNRGKPALLQGLEMNGRLVLVYSKEGLNDVANAEGCCCCGGSEIKNSAVVSANIFTYAAVY